MKDLDWMVSENMLGENIMQDWLDSLKEGDEVVISKRSWRGWTEKITNVERRTPTGRIVVDGVTFLPNGQKFKGWDGYACIEPVNEELTYSHD